MAIHSGLTCPQSGPYKNSAVQDGHSRVGSAGSEGRGLGNISRFDGCVFPSENTCQQQEISAVWDTGESIPVQGVSNGSIAISRGVYHGGETSQDLPPKERSPYTTISGRLADFQWERGPHGGTYPVSSAGSTTIGISSQRGEIRAQPQTEFSVSRVLVRPDSRDSQGERRQVGKDTELYSSFPTKGHKTNSSQVAVAIGVVGVDRKTSSTRDVAFESSTAGATRYVGPEERQPRAVASSVRPGQGGFDLVDNPGKCLRGSSIGRGVSHPPSVYRCQSRRLGRSSEFPNCKRHLGYSGEEPSHKCAGNVSCSKGTETFPTCDPEQTCAHMFRQSHHSVLYQEARGHSVQRDDEGHTQIVYVAGGASDSSVSQAYYRQAQCPGRFLVQKGTDCADRMESVPTGGREVVADMGQANGRLIRDQVQQQDELIFLPDPGSHSNGSGCLVGQLEGVSGLCLPPNSDCEQSAQQGREGGLCRDIGGTVVDKTSLVSNIVRTVSGCSSTIAIQTETVETTTEQCLPRQSSDDAAPRMEIVKQALVARGFSEKVAIRMAKAQKGSSLDIYESKWRGFASWCDQRDANPCEADVCLVAEFLCDLHEERKLAVSTIEGYRTAISHTLKALKGSDLGTDPQLLSLIGNFARDQSADRVKAPEWDLAFVLGTLLEEPFEPLDKAKLWF